MSVSFGVSLCRPGSGVRAPFTRAQAGLPAVTWRSDPPMETIVVSRSSSSWRAAGSVA